jgi:hypothetical protein
MKTELKAELKYAHIQDLEVHFLSVKTVTDGFFTSRSYLGMSWPQRISVSRFTLLRGSLQAAGLSLKYLWKRIQRAPAYVAILLQRAFSCSDQIQGCEIITWLVRKGRGTIQIQDFNIQRGTFRAPLELNLDQL